MADKTDVKFTGVIWNSKKVEKIIGQETKKVLDEAAQFGEIAVKQQLYPGHGLLTGFLRESVTGTRVDRLHAIIDAGEVTQGKNVVYANYIEGLYRMFYNAWQLLRRKNLAQLLAKRIAGRLNG